MYRRYTTTSSALIAVVCLQFFLLNVQAIATPIRQGKVVVTGATGRVGRLVVSELLRRTQNAANESISISVTAAARDVAKAQRIFSKDLPNVNIVQCDLYKNNDISKICKDADAIIWCATGFSQASSPLDKLFSFLSLTLAPKKSMDIVALQSIGDMMRKNENNLCKNGPQVVMCSSASVTRPTWSAEKKVKFIGAADIPIVRLNPLNILGNKRESEAVLRESGVRYCIVRPCGISDNWPEGRPVVCQGDIAVGRISPADTASLLVDALLDGSSAMKTFESIALPGFPKPQSYTDQFTRLTEDGAPPPTEDALAAQYALLQQLVPGETLAPNRLAMGQTYEQLDKGVQGRLGARGKEQAPIKIDA